MTESSSWEELIEAAKQASQRAYAPYSKFQVGAALRGRGGSIYAGCNVENASFGATLCAERGAIARMVCDGETEVVATVVYVVADDPALPCGICRQSLAELADPQMRILSLTPTQSRELSLGELLPYPFLFKPP